MRNSGNRLWIVTAVWSVVCANVVLTFRPPPFSHSYVLLLLQHVVVAGLVASALWYVFRESAGGRFWVVLGGLLALAFPVFGPAAAALLLLPFQPLVARLRPDLEAPGTLEEEGPAPPPPRKARPAEADLQAFLDIEPYADLLWSPDATVKKSVINAIAERPSPQLIGLLRWCLSDPRPDVYQLALARLGKIQAAHADEIFHATERTRSHQDSVPAHRGLAQAYERFVESGLLEGAIQQYYRQMALDSYHAVLAREPGNAVALEAIARLAAAAGRFDEALTVYQNLLRVTGSVRGQLGMLEVWYERARLTGDLEALHSLFTAVRDWRAARASTERSGQNAEELQRLEWWLGVESDG